MDVSASSDCNVHVYCRDRNNGAIHCRDKHAFSAMTQTVLVEHQEEHLVCEKKLSDVVLPTHHLLLH